MVCPPGGQNIDAISGTAYCNDPLSPADTCKSPRLVTCMHSDAEVDLRHCNVDSSRHPFEVFSTISRQSENPSYTIERVFSLSALR